MRKLVTITVLLLSVPIAAFPQLRSAVIVLQLKTNGDTVPSLFYTLHDTVVYDLGKGTNGIYEECIPGKMLTVEAAFAIHAGDRWEEIATIGQLEEQGVCSNGTITLTLSEIKRILPSDPEDPREYKTPPKPYHRVLLSDGSFPFTDYNCESYQLLLVASSAADSLFCSTFLPKQAQDGTYYVNDTAIKYPMASCIDKTMDSLRLELRNYYHECESEEAIKPAIKDITLIVDERGIIKGLFLFVEKEKQNIGRNIATKILYRFQNEKFHPAKDWVTEEPVPDLVKFFL